MAKKRPIVIRKIPSEQIPSHVTEDTKEYIRGHYDTMPRRKLAERTGLSKIDLNLTIIGMGLSKEKPEREKDDAETKSA